MVTRSNPIRPRLMRLRVRFMRTSVSSWRKLRVAGCQLPATTNSQPATISAQLHSSQTFECSCRWPAYSAGHRAQVNHDDTRRMEFGAGRNERAGRETLGMPLGFGHARELLAKLPANDRLVLFAVGHAHLARALTQAGILTALRRLILIVLSAPL